MRVPANPSCDPSSGRRENSERPVVHGPLGICRQPTLKIATADEIDQAGCTRYFQKPA